MPDVGIPSSSPQTHTSTQEWQSFEIRMRRRRAERCVLRAEVALDAGFEDDARAALDEARQLDWHTPDFESLKARVAQRHAAEAAETPHRSGSRRLISVAAAVLALVAAGAAWFVQDQPTEPPVTVATAPAPPPPAPLAAPLASATSAPAEPALEPAPAADDVARPLPDNQPAPVARVEQPVSNPDRLRSERTVSGPGGLKPGPTGSEPPVGETGRGGPGLPQLAVPTTSVPVQQSVPAATGLIGRSSIGTVTPPPVAEPRVPDLPPPPPVASPSPPRAEPTPAPDDSGVRAALAQYESAYTSLNASAAHAVYPGVDERSLERAFDSLAAQRVSLGRCSISLSGARAQATCQGTASWTPKVGGGTRSSPRTWRFDLANAGGAWKITRADAR